VVVEVVMVMEQKRAAMAALVAAVLGVALLAAMAIHHLPLHLKVTMVEQEGRVLLNLLALAVAVQVPLVKMVRQKWAVMEAQEPHLQLQGYQ